MQQSDVGGGEADEPTPPENGQMADGSPVIVGISALRCGTALVGPRRATTRPDLSRGKRRSQRRPARPADVVSLQQVRAELNQDVMLRRGFDALTHYLHVELARK